MKKIITLLCLIASFNSLAQEKAKQDSSTQVPIINHQPLNIVGISNSISTNPAYTGFEESHVIDINGKWDKPLFDISPGFYYPITYGLSYNTALGKKKNNGIGLYGDNKFIGVEILINSDLTYSYNFRIKQENNLRFGIGIFFKKGIFNYDSLSFPDEIDRRHGFMFNSVEIPPASNTKINTGLNLGVFYNYRNFYTGLSFNKILQFSGFFNSKPELNPEINFYAGYNFKINNHSVFPSVSFEYQSRICYFTPTVFYSYKNIFVAGINAKNLVYPGIIAGVDILKTVFISLSCNAFADNRRIDAFGYIESVSANLKLSFGK